MGGFSWFLVRRDCQFQLVEPIQVGRKGSALVERLQPHPVFVEHTVGRDHAAPTVNEEKGRLLTVQVVQLFCAGTAAMGVQVMPAANGLQVGEVINDRDPVTAEGQVDEVLDRGNVSGRGDGFELDALVIVKALQPLGQIVQLIEVRHAAFQPLQDRISAADLVDLAVPPGGVPQIQRPKQLQRLGIYVFPQGKGYGGLAMFRVQWIAEYRTKHRGIPPLH